MKDKYYIIMRHPSCPLQNVIQFFSWSSGSFLHPQPQKSSPLTSNIPLENLRELEWYTSRIDDYLETTKEIR